MTKRKWTKPSLETLDITKTLGGIVIGDNEAEYTETTGGNIWGTDS